VQTFDTNVVVRILLGDDPVQTALAARSWRAALRSGGVYLPVVVLIETVWVLAHAAKLGRERIAAELGRLTAVEGVRIEQPALIGRAIERYASGGADFADYVVLESAREYAALPVGTFDRRFAREPDVRLIDPAAVKDAPNP
jgi:predicted nucleic-acid-binding protein